MRYLCILDLPYDGPRVTAASQHYLVHSVLSEDSTLRRQTDVGVFGCSQLERHRGPAAQRHADVDVRVSNHGEHTTCSAKQDS